MEILMTQRCCFNMKNLILLALLVPSFSFAQVTERSFEALVRNDNERPEIEQVVLKNLVSNDSFDGEHFRIVKGKADEAIRFDEEEEGLRFRAATVYHHLTIARNYFIEKMKSDYVAQIPKMTIRIEHTNQFHANGPFANDAKEPQYNNALTIPGGKNFRTGKEWGTEIWFRPSKKIHLRDLKTNNLQAQEFHVLMASFRKQTHMQTIQAFLTGAVMAATKDNSAFFEIKNVVRVVGASVVMEAGYQFFDPITKLFTRKWYWLDTALVPEIIYHEYSHVALSDHLGLDGSTAIVEGMADFFAGKIADSPKLATHIKKYNTYNGKDATRKQEYKIQMEQGEMANTDFVFGLLWSMGEIVGKSNEESFMFELRKKTKPNDYIRKEFIEALLQNCDEHCTSPFTDKLRILKALNLKGL